MANKIRFYFDEHMPRAVEKGLLNQGYTIIMAVDVDMMNKDDDSEHLPFATGENAVVVIRDNPLPDGQQKRTDHAGLICWTGVDDDFGGMIRALVEFGEKYTPEEVAGQVFWLK